MFLLINPNVSTLLVVLSPKSVIFIKNNKGHNTDPCGIPLKTDFQFMCNVVYV